MISKYSFGNQLSKENFQAIRSLAKKLSFSEFNKATGFGRGIHNRARRFSSYQDYKKYTKTNSEKYYPRGKKRDTERKTVNDVYSKLESIETEILEIKSLVSH